MPAVSCRLGPVRQVVDESHALADSVAEALVAWLGGLNRETAEVTVDGSSCT